MSGCLNIGSGNNEQIQLGNRSIPAKHKPDDQDFVDGGNIATVITGVYCALWSVIFMECDDEN